MGQYGSGEHRPWQTRESGRDEDRWRGETRGRGERERWGRESEEDLGARDEWRDEYPTYGERGRREWRGPQGEDRRLAATRGRSWDRDRDPDWERRYGARSGGGRVVYGGYGPQERWGEYRGEDRPEVDPPWVERGPDARRAREDSRGLVEWEDRGPIKWLGDKLREFTGRPSRGPKGYTRSDERIFDDVCERIARSGVDADDVEVKVEKREVTLTGTVRNRAEKWRLEEVAEDVFGVEDVHNQLKVPRTGPFERGTSGRTDAGSLEDPRLRH
jgi:hypothetical protein